LKQFIKDWILPPKIKHFLEEQISLYRVKKLGTIDINRNRELENIYNGQRCFILGNAPTINNIDIKVLENEYVFVMSTFYNHPEYSKLKKAFLSCVDVTGSKSEEDTLKWMKSISKNTPTTQTYFFDLKQKTTNEENKLFEGKDVYYIATANIERSFDISKFTRGYSTNIIQVLEIAMYMGFKEIFLHSVNINLICGDGRYSYFFNKDKLPIADPNLNANGVCVHDFFVQVETTHVVFQELKIIHKYALEKGIKIYYTNKESLLKFCEYKEFESIFK